MTKGSTTSEEHEYSCCDFGMRSTSHCSQLTSSTYTESKRTQSSLNENLAQFAMAQRAGS